MVNITLDSIHYGSFVCSRKYRTNHCNCCKSRQDARENSKAASRTSSTLTTPQWGAYWALWIYLLQGIQLTAQVSDFRIVIATVQETARQLQKQEQDLALIQHLLGLVAIAAHILSEVDEIGKDHLTRHLEEQSLESLFLAWKFWLRKHGNLQDLSHRMKQVRVNIATTLTLLTAWVKLDHSITYL